LVTDALDGYLESFGGKDLENTRRRIEAIIRPQIGAHDTAKLTAKIIKYWHSALANAPARLRTAPGAIQNYRPTADTYEARRSRRSSANRILTILKAALNVAYRNEKVVDANAWRRVKPFAKAGAPRLRYLADNESRMLVSSCHANFRPMVIAALLTGARYSELAALEVRDFDRQSQSLWLRETKAGTPRAVY
jgi:integrase